MNALGQIEIKLNSKIAFTKKRFVTAMLLGHYWQHLGKIKQVEISETYLPKYEVTEINYPYLSFKNDYKECAYSLFASQLVMPSRAVNTRVYLSKGQRSSIFKMIRSARDFQVPLNVMIQRIETLSLR
jgi:Zn-dependent peptidase ImmA (M78 family)